MPLPPPSSRTVAVFTQAQALMQRGQAAAAMKVCEQAVQDGIGDPVLFLEMTNLYLHLGRHEEAYQAGMKVLETDPEETSAHFNMGLAGMRTNRYEAALNHFQTVLKHDPHNVRALTNLGGVYFGLGFIKESLAQYREALRLDESVPGIWQNYISILNYDEDAPLSFVMEQHRMVGEKLLAMAGPRPAGYANDPAPDRRLRIGYLSGDFIMHPASHYVEPVLRLHDKSAFDLYAYSLITWSDPVTEGFRSCVPNWRDVGMLSDEKLFDMIQADRIDILVDLSGHTARNRILTVARKPAPVMVNWIGYLNTLGIPGIDYSLLDPHLLSPSANAGFVDRPWALPETAYCYTPLVMPRQLAPSPVFRKGHITFGCFNNPAKLSRAAFAAWGEILRNLPDSRLIFKYKTFNSPMVQERVLHAMAEQGVGADRLTFEGYSPLGPFLDGFGEIDIALDTFPYTGVTTTMHTLWVGTPIVTLAGDTPMQRFGRSALLSIGRPDWIAATPRDYVAIALRLAEEVKADPDLRRKVQRRMRSSSMMRHEVFVRHLESAYRGMWQAWCAGQGAS